MASMFDIFRRPAANGSSGGGMLSMLSPQDQDELRRASMLQFGAGMLGASGWSPTPQNLGQGLAAGMDRYADARSRMVPGMLQGAQMRRQVARDEEEAKNVAALTEAMDSGEWSTVSHRSSADQPWQDSQVRRGVDEGKRDAALARLFPKETAMRSMPDNETRVLGEGDVAVRNGEVVARGAPKPPGAPSFITLQKTGEQPITLRTTDPVVQDRLLQGWTEVKTPATQVSFNDAKIPTPPEGHDYVRGPDGQPKVTADGKLQVYKIEGGPAADAATRQVEAQQAAAKIVLEDIDRAIEGAGFWTTGFAGGRLKDVEGTPAHDLGKLVNGIKANVSFDKLQQMRQMSPTGGALGAVSNMENELLQSVLGSLETSQSKEQFIFNLDRLRDQFNIIVHGTTMPRGMPTMRFDAKGNRIQ